MARPSDYTDDLAAEICGQIAEGLSLRKICAQEGMPDKSTIFRWIAKHPQFCDQYEKAKEQGCEAMAEELLDIADDAENDYIETEQGEKFNGEAVARSRLRVDTRKWLLSKLKMKKYGDKVENTLQGPNGGPVETVNISPKEYARRLAFSLQKAKREDSDAS